ncbi:hypothetical protein [Variovorax sp. LT1P1]|uniref:hypothetical protein n=1 Tax=Variovorax sp. LT1P1 TaxID=3443730 RepID=UPI003F498945
MLQQRLLVLSAAIRSKMQTGEHGPLQCHGCAMQLSGVLPKPREVVVRVVHGPAWAIRVPMKANRCEQFH